MTRLLLVLKRGAKLFAVFAALAAATLASAYLLDSAGGFGSSARYRVTELLLAPEWVVHRWLHGQADQEDPILFLHLIVGIEGLVVFVLRYFLVCLALAFCWTWIESRTTST